MRMVLVSFLFVLPGFLVPATLAAQETVQENPQRMRVTTIRFERGPRYNASADVAQRPVVVVEQVPSGITEPTRAHSAETFAAIPQSVLVAHPVMTGSQKSGQALGANQVGYQQVPADGQASPSDFQLDLRRTLNDENSPEIIVDSRYETLDYYDSRYPTSEYDFIGGDQARNQHVRTPIGFCEYRHKNNPFCAYYQECGGTPGCCDEWADFCPCFGLSRFRYIGKKDCFYGKTGCRARHAYRHGKWVHAEEEQSFGCLDCNAR
ncbi:MAG: hypothetical protein MK108_14515 [Mariniblastus sp.]|nr:hypothetical protein [Mariniblastus sp.]